MVKFLLVLCSLVSVAVSSETKIQLCGRELARARVLLCYGSQYVSKRTAQDNLITALSDVNGKWMEVWPWSGRRGSLSADWSRYKRDSGLADECCLNPCTTNVILAYC